MLIRVEEHTLRDLPDDLAALILADPSYINESPIFTSHEVNILVHGVFGTFYDPALSFEDNVEKVREMYSSIDKPTEESYLLACEAIKKYNQEIAECDIGLVDKDEFFSSPNALSQKKIT